MVDQDDAQCPRLTRKGVVRKSGRGTTTDQQQADQDDTLAKTMHSLHSVEFQQMLNQDNTVCLLTIGVRSWFPWEVKSALAGRQARGMFGKPKSPGLAVEGLYLGKGIKGTDPRPWSVPIPVDTNLRWIIPTKEQCS
ncbi:hypothetical protein BI347_19130 [Chromobacterium sphagni]|uniref:Uncharacterized protein n=1 Tax=Chromobacterium sphagni TaxID=1903179 RepID=A0A1S1WTS4_9NEIS|nr:hypothetical protein BI347_19130 [Chromobacterium sphagni]